MANSKSTTRAKKSSAAAPKPKKTKPSAMSSAPASSPATSPSPTSSSSPLVAALLAIDEPKIPPALASRPLPPLVLADGSGAIERSTMDGLLRALLWSKVSEDPLKRLVRTNATLESRDALALALLQFWEEKEFHGRHDWVLDAVVGLGGAQSIIALAACMAAWPGQSDTGRKRTIQAVPALVAAGTDTALLALCGLRQTAVVPSVLEAIIEGLNRAVDDRNTTLSELFDAITPTLGLDAHGRRSFDYGSQRFMVAFDDHFEPHLRDEAGHATVDLPPPEATDDPSRVDAARAAWTSLSAQLREAVKVQTFRLEQDMITGRRWDAATWSRCLRDHPLLVSFTRRIVWGLYDKNDALIGAFRTAEDHSLVDRDDAEFVLPSDARIGVLHPLHLDDGARSAWGTHFADYEIIQPFAQLGRALHRVTDEERQSEAAIATTRFADQHFKSGVLRDVLVRKGWERDPSFHREYYQRTFTHDGVVAIATMSPGVAAGSASYDVADQTIPTIEFRKKKGRGKSREPITLAEVPPVAFSEAVIDLADVLVEQELAKESATNP